MNTKTSLPTSLRQIKEDGLLVPSLCEVNTIEANQHHDLHSGIDKYAKSFLESVDHRTQRSQATNIHLYLSELLLQTAEADKWAHLVENVDFSTDVGAPYTIKPTCNQSLLHDVDNQASTSSNDITMTCTSSQTLELVKSENSGDLTADQVVQSLVSHFERERLLRGEHFVSLISGIDTRQNLLQLNSYGNNGRTLFQQLAAMCNIINGQSKDQLPREFIDKLVDQELDWLTLLREQSNRCAGCGRVLSSFYARRARICHYYNKLFCQCCHQGAKKYIPARILHQWNFREYPVCDAALEYICDLETQPIFNVHSLDTSIRKRVRNLRKICFIRMQISHLWQYIQRCPYAVVSITSYGLLRTVFESVPSRFLNLDHIDLFSLIDFERINNGNLLEMLEPLAVKGAEHVMTCAACETFGFLCQICHAPDQVLFPFQGLNRIYRCDGCGSLCHMRCYLKQMKRFRVWKCGRCERLSLKRRTLQESDDWC